MAPSTSAPKSPPPLEDDEEEGEEEDEESPVTEPPTGQSYQKLSFCLKSACANYGPTAPFTLALLENQSESWLTPNDWYFLARAALSGGDFVLWKTDFTENCREVAQRNAEKASSKTWTLQKLLGNAPYDKNETQATFRPGLLAQMQSTYHRKGQPPPPLPRSARDQMSRIVTLSPDLMMQPSPGETESTFVKHLAFENAYPACQDVLRPHRDRTLPSPKLQLGPLPCHPRRCSSLCLSAPL
ncbi:hypothetical protein STEG23_019004 [Scotinomys teguina]